MNWAVLFRGNGFSFLIARLHLFPWLNMIQSMFHIVTWSLSATAQRVVTNKSSEVCSMIIKSTTWSYTGWVRLWAACQKGIHYFWLGAVWAQISSSAYFLIIVMKSYILRYYTCYYLDLISKTKDWNHKQRSKFSKRNSLCHHLYGFVGHWNVFLEGCVCGLESSSVIR